MRPGGAREARQPFWRPTGCDPFFPTPGVVVPADATFDSGKVCQLSTPAPAMKTNIRTLKHLRSILATLILPVVTQEP